jgi:hypothetical protein
MPSRYLVTAFAIGALAVTIQVARAQIGIWAQTDAQAQAAFASNKKQYESVVGKNFWVKFPLRFCPQPDERMPECATLDSRSQLLVDRLEPGIQHIATGKTVLSGRPYCHAKSEGGVVGYVMCSELIASATDVDPAAAAAECKRRGEPRVGMSAKQLEATCWGKPVAIKRNETAAGIADKYLYDGDRSVLLHDGVVVSMRTLHLVPAAR